MFAYEIRVVDGSVFCCDGFDSKYEAECVMYEFIDEFDLFDFSANVKECEE